MSSSYHRLPEEQYGLDSIASSGNGTHSNGHSHQSHSSTSSFSKRGIAESTGSVEERKKIWWRDAVINCCFIGTWWVISFFNSFKFLSWQSYLSFRSFHGRYNIELLFHRFVFATLLSLYNKVCLPCTYSWLPSFSPPLTASMFSLVACLVDIPCNRLCIYIYFADIRHNSAYTLWTQHKYSRLSSSPNAKQWMFSPQKFGFPSPLFVTMIHMFIQFILAASLRYFFPRSFKPSDDRRPTLDDYGKKAFPCAAATGLDIGLSNLSLKTITLSFYSECFVCVVQMRKY